MEGPEAGVHIGGDDEAVGVSNVESEAADHDVALARFGPGLADGVLLVDQDRSVVRVIRCDGIRIGRIHHVERLDTVFIRGDEYVRPAYLVIMRQALPTLGPCTDRS